MSTIARRAAEALDSCPKQSYRQRALLHVLLDDPASAATLLDAAPGLGWSDDEHPGHLLFPLFATLLSESESLRNMAHRASRGMDIEEHELPTLDHDDPRLSTPEIDQIFERAGLGVLANSDAREAVIDSMRTAAERRVEGVVRNRRRQHYEHAASLVAICAAIDPSPTTARWLTRLRDEYRRYPALRAELDRALSSDHRSDHASR